MLVFVLIKIIKIDQTESLNMKKSNLSTDHEHIKISHDKGKTSKTIYFC